MFYSKDLSWKNPTTPGVVVEILTAEGGGRTQTASMIHVPLCTYEFCRGTAGDSRLVRVKCGFLALCVMVKNLVSMLETIFTIFVFYLRRRLTN